MGLSLSVKCDDNYAYRGYVLAHSNDRVGPQATFHLRQSLILAANSLATGSGNVVERS